MKNLLLRAAGAVCVALGTLGVFVPVLPTTPFVLLAAGCFAASSPRMYAWLVRNKRLGPFIENYRHGCGVPKKRKREALLFLWGGLCLSAALVRQPLVWGILIIVGIGVTLHLMLIKTAEQEKEKPAQDSRKEGGPA
ncbi:MAG TPA: YbaN family protein [Feifaniaceae bacterium]|nr:YbaN family protein [Feifaniaceae bacterium]